jgi:hypothetical protein
MNRNFIVLAVAVNILTIGLGGFIAYSDLYLREYTSLYQHEVKVTEIEYLPLMYRPTYDYYYGSSFQESEHTTSKGSWSLDFLQLSTVIMVIANLAWISFKRQQKRKILQKHKGDITIMERTALLLRFRIR